MKSYAIVLAAGKGTRMGTKISKQFLEVNGKPLFFYALDAFEKSDVDSVILVTSKEYKDYCENLLSLYKEEKVITEKLGNENKYIYKKLEKVVIGGAERYDSVYEGLCAIEKADFVLIHDGARPAIKVETINKTIEEVQKYKACVVAVPVKDTIKKVNEELFVEETPDRGSLWQMQTPQAFEYDLIKNAYECVLGEKAENITDDAMVLEKFDPEAKIKMVPGDYSNIKVTTIDDLELLKVFLKS